MHGKMKPMIGLIVYPKIEIATEIDGMQIDKIMHPSPKAKVRFQF